MQIIIKYITFITKLHILGLFLYNINNIYYIIIINYETHS